MDMERSREECESAIENDFPDSVRSRHSNIYMSITRFVVLQHVVHHLSFQPCFVHRETQLIDPVVVHEALLDVHLDNLVTAILVGTSWF